MRISPERIEKLLYRVQKPARYRGGELNSIVKDKASFRMAISYPDMYEVGMSNNGIRILYDRVNRGDDLACERVFAVAHDFEEILRGENVPLYSLETLTPLCELDLVGFNLSHELLATNVLQILDLGKIPLLRRERDLSHPFIIGGGSASSNPFPYSDFFDAFFIGDGEDGMLDIIHAIRDGKKSGGSRDDILDSLASVDGVLVPSRYTFSYEGCHTTDIKGDRVRKRVYRGEPSDPEKPIVPSMRITQDRAVVELTRGCRNLCRYCHAGYYDLPYRKADRTSLKKRIDTIMSNTGYGELTLSSLSISDYRELVPLLNDVLPSLTENGISISLPSMRVDRESLPVIERLSDVRKTSLTFAVETGSERMRNIAGKSVSTEELLDIISHVFKRGWKVIKLYFMLGMPGCKDEDEVEGIISLLRDIARLGGKGRDINVTLSPFIPKPHTPFERENQMPSDYFYQAVGRIRSASPRSVKIKNHDIAASTLEGVLARGDERLGAVILQTYLEGARFDSWKEFFRSALWFRNLDDLLPFWCDYFGGRQKEEILPWSVIRTGFESVIHAESEKKDCVSVKRGRAVNGKSLDVQSLDNAMELFSKRYAVTSKIRLRLTKKKAARFISHLDFAEVVRRAIRMAGIPVAYTQGFNKHERISFGYPVPLGIDSESELCDIELCGNIPDMSKLSDCLPDGIDAVSWSIPEEKGSLMAAVKGIEYHVTLNDSAARMSMVDALSCLSTMTIHLEEKKRDIPLAGAIIRSEVAADGSMILLLSAGGEESVRIDTLLRIITGRDDYHDWSVITKTAQYGKSDELYLLG